MRSIRPGMPGTMGPRGPMPATNVLPSKPAPAIGGGGPANPMPRPTSMPMTNVKPSFGMKKGGSASSRADGCAQRGKTKGKII